MPALTQPRNTPTREGRALHDPVAASTRIFAGSLMCLNAAGFAVPGSTATTLKARGVVQKSVDNSNGGNGDAFVTSERGVFRFNNDAVDAIDRSHIEGTAWIVDDNTVAATDGGDPATRSAAGNIIDVDDNGVWVEIQ